MTEKFAALKASEHAWLEFGASSKPKCPHCGADFDIADNEAWELYDEVGGPHEVTCPSCDGDFSVSSSASWTFSTDEQDDLS